MVFVKVSNFEEAEKVKVHLKVYFVVLDHFNFPLVITMQEVLFHFSVQANDFR